jgi:hypothetical protein
MLLLFSHSIDDWTRLFFLEEMPALGQNFVISQAGIELRDAIESEVHQRFFFGGVFLREEANAYTEFGHSSRAIGMHWKIFKTI